MRGRCGRPLFFVKHQSEKSRVRPQATDIDMSTYELLAAINHLPPDERLALLESVVHSLREELGARERSGVPVEQVRGALKTQGETMTDDEAKEDYTRHLTEKYS